MRGAGGPGRPRGGQRDEAPRLLRFPAWRALLLASRPVRAAERVRIEVEGLDRDLRRNILATLSLEEAARRRRPDRGPHPPPPRPGSRRRSRPRCSLSATTGPPSRRRWSARATPGSPPTRSTRAAPQGDQPRRAVTGEGSDDAEFRRLVREFPLEQGETLFHPDYEAGKTSFEEYAAEPTAISTPPSRPTRSGSTSRATPRRWSSTTTPARATASGR